MEREDLESRNSRLTREVECFRQEMEERDRALDELGYQLEGERQRCEGIE
jgi:hypothetical protein